MKPYFFVPVGFLASFATKDITNMELSERSRYLSSIFSLENRVEIEDSRIEIIPFSFIQSTAKEEISQFQGGMPTADFCTIPDSGIVENKEFDYAVFVPKTNQIFDKAILLLHGLNERSWDKYLLWAEDLAVKCNRPVILFPIAFHMNRSPRNWSSPRWIMPWLDKRKERFSNPDNATFANLALSSRLSISPLRFYASGRESALNVIQLFSEIKDGQHPVFKENTSIDLFAYSIGALLSEVLLLDNHNGLFTDSKLFTFCGGSVFERMDGNARDILDRESFDKIKRYYLEDFMVGKHHEEYPSVFPEDSLEYAFKTMIRSEQGSIEREKFFKKADIEKRIKMILLRRDRVVPTIGAKEAVGKSNSASMVEELDFPFEYSHQVPFPIGNNKVNAFDIQECFRRVFDKATLLFA